MLLKSSRVKWGIAPLLLSVLVLSSCRSDNSSPVGGAPLTPSSPAKPEVSATTKPYAISSASSTKEKIGMGIKPNAEGKCVKDTLIKCKPTKNSKKINHEPCSLNYEKVKAAHACRRADKNCLPSWLPSRVRAIQRGVITEFVGLFVNDGNASWSAVDFQSGELIQVQRYAGPFFDTAPKVASPSPQHYTKETNSGGNHWIDEVRVVAITAEKREQIACLAQPLWADADAPSTPATDVINVLYLLGHGVVRRHEALFGQHVGLAEQVRAAIEPEQGEQSQVRDPLW
jgi:hypothetical protein